MPDEIQFFRPPSVPRNADATKPLLLFLPGVDGTGLAGATQWPRLREFDVHAMRLPVERGPSFDRQAESYLVSYQVTSASSEVRGLQERRRASAESLPGASDALLPSVEAAGRGQHVDTVGSSHGSPRALLWTNIVFHAPR